MTMVSSVASNLRHQPIGTQTYKIITQYGDIQIIKQFVQPAQNSNSAGAANTSGQSNEQQQQQSRPVIMTFHDLGLNSELQFATFCECDEVKLMLQTFTIIHVNFIGQEFVVAPATTTTTNPPSSATSTPTCSASLSSTLAGAGASGGFRGGGGQTAMAAPSLPDDFKYPTVEQMAECIVDICAQMRIRSFVALAVGAGAHVVSSLALLRPDLVHGLFLINPVISSCSITEWLYFKMSAIASNHQVGSSSSSSSSSHHHHHHHHHGHHGHHHKDHRHHHHQHPPSQQQDNTHQSNHNQGELGDHHERDHDEGSLSKQHHQSGLRKFFNAASRLPHFHSHAAAAAAAQGDNQDPQLDPRDSPTNTELVGDDSSSNQGAQLDSPGDSESSTSTASRPASSRLRQLILSRNFRLGHSHHHHHQHQQQASHQQPHHHHHHQHKQLARASSSTMTIGSASSTSTSELAAAAAAGQPQHIQQEAASGASGSAAESPGMRRRMNPASARHSCESLDLVAAAAPSASDRAKCNKRPPIEYLMYHHFGGATFQRYRRPSTSNESPLRTQSSRADRTDHDEGDDGDNQSTSGPTNDTDPLAAAAKPYRRSSGGNPVSSSSSLASKQGSPASASLRGLRSLAKTGRQEDDDDDDDDGEGGGGRGASSRSQDSLAGAAASGATSTMGRHQQHHKRRSNSICLSASYLASFSSDRQRLAYVQNVYKSYFYQINPHNLWLFAQSFVKRRTLNLRKDCGAAAHAAAAAAALGTSICAAFVGVGAPMAAGGGGSASSHHQFVSHQQVTTSMSNSSSGLVGSVASELEPLAATPGTSTTTNEMVARKPAQQQQQQQQSQQSQQQQPQPPPPPPPAPAKQQALVAGTKVKRTFTCQTLIMCSSVQIHCERAIKLMSLLNPLQATWIKTDQLLVLEEKPEKVCQALRLFLQGIGYSMSTYERRLRLSSAQGSVSSSADSTGSARSLNERSASGSVSTQPQ